MAAVLVSQIVIFQSWTDAKFGSIANVIILVPIIVSLLNALPSKYQHRYRAEVERRLLTTDTSSIVTSEDVQHLPAPLQNYLRYVGAIGRPKIHNFRAVFQGGMKRTRESGWMDISSQQYDFLDDPARFFYIESTLFGIPFDGLHVYIGNSATMQIKVAALFEIVDAKGEKMYQGETVTLFNDMCLMAPVTLIDKTIQWESVGSQAVKGRFTNKGITITAVLSFNEKGELTNFISNDRFHSADGKLYTSYPWSTPVREYKDFGGRKVPSHGEAIWQTPEGEYSYAKFQLLEIEYNCSEFK
jgi:hypothetical protein